MTIDAAYGKQTRLPFDYCITEKAALLAGLRSRGRSFQHEAASSEVFVMPLSRREGVYSSGVYFWHDYPLASRNGLCDDWQASVPGVNEKYEFIWRRFLEELARPGEIIFTLSTTQDNLAEFASGEEDWQRKFAIDGAFVDELADALGALCTDHFTILVFARSVGEADSIRAQCRFKDVKVRFCGALSLPTHKFLAEALGELTRSCTSDALRLLEGIYDNGAAIEYYSDDVARIYKVAGERETPWAECYSLPGGYLVNFTSRRNSIFNATLTNQCLKFSNGSSWSKL